jgi:uncharacterized protein YkwD
MAERRAADDAYNQAQQERETRAAARQAAPQAAPPRSESSGEHVPNAFRYDAPSTSPRQTPSDAQVREAIVRASVNAYLATGRPCACPYNTMRNGASCGGRSAHSRPGGAAPLCYPSDVSDAEVDAFRRSLH